ncbi:MAG: hypothetical protein OK474_04635 [Thaumarchaeota archaeon]|nr:hypothetical protein [Nitrososphaerota archaeon]
MENNPLAFFGMLLNVCINDEWKKESMLTATAVSFALGMVASVATAYAISMAHAFV